MSSTVDIGTGVTGLMAEANTTTPAEENPQNRRLTGPELASLVMSNDVVLDKITPYLPARFLLGLRRSCTSWNFNFMPKLQKLTKDIILTNGHRRSGYSGMIDIHRMDDLLEPFHTSSDIPFSSFCFYLGDDEDPSQHLEKDCLFEFLIKFGNNVTNLELHSRHCANLQISDLNRLIFDLAPELIHLKLRQKGVGPSAPSYTEPAKESICQKHLSKLKRISVSVTHDYQHATASSVSPAFTRFISDVIKWAEGLEELELYHAAREPGGENDLVRPILVGMPAISHINQLKALRLPVSLTNTELQTLIALAKQDGNALKLESFSTIVFRTRIPGMKEQGEEDLQLLYDFLATQSSTLRKLKLYFANDEDEDQELCKIPRMERLEKLSIVFSKLNQVELQFPDSEMGFLMNAFPQLKKVSYHYKPDDYLALRVRRLAHPGVTSLKLKTEATDYVGFFRFFGLNYILTRLNLIFTLTKEYDERTGKIKDIHVDPKEFSDLWTIWPDLTTVQIGWRGDGLIDLDLDAFLSGVPRMGLERLKDKFNLTAASPDSDSLRKMVDRYKTRPGISDLKNLREFTITFPDNDAYPQLTDIGGYCGIAFVSPTILHLELQGLGKNLVSEQCLAFIRSKLGPLAVLNL